MNGVFQGDEDLPQLTMQQIGPQAKGVLVVDASHAQPYLAAKQPVSQLRHMLQMGKAPVKKAAPTMSSR